MNRKTVLCLLAGALLLLAGCEKQAGVTAGTYLGSGSGHKGAVVLSVDVDEKGAITGIAVTEQAEDPEHALQALQTLPDRIVAEQSLGVDVVSGATITSRAILEAAADAVSQAGLDPAALGYVSPEEISNADTVTLVGLSEGMVQFTGEQLKTAYEPVTLTAVSISSSGEEKEVVATGVTLATILEGYGADLADYTAVLTVASDGYSIEIPGAILRTRDVLIAYEVNGEPQRPRTVIPGERAMYWSKFLSRIELLGAAETEEEPVTKVLLLESAIQSLVEVSEPYKYYDRTGSAIPIAALLERYIQERADFVRIRSTDQLDKSERYDVFRQQYILYEGADEDVPLFIGPDLPTGMRVKQMLTIKVGPVCMVSLSRAQEVQEAPMTMADFLEPAGLPLEDLAEYRLEGIDGEPLILNGAALSEATLSLDGDGLPLIRFPDGRFNGLFTGLLSVTLLSGETP